MNQLRTTPERRQSLRLVTCTRCLGAGKISPWCARCDDPTQDHDRPTDVVCPRCMGARTLPNTKTILELLDDIDTLISERDSLREVEAAAGVMCSVYLGRESKRYLGPQQKSFDEAIEILDTTLAQVPR